MFKISYLLIIKTILRLKLLPYMCVCQKYGIRPTKFITSVFTRDMFGEPLWYEEK